MSDNPFDMLGVPAGADEERVEQAFRKLSLEAHPDRPGGSDEAMTRLSWAKDEALQAIRRRTAIAVYREIAANLAVQQQAEREQQRENYKAAVQRALFRFRSPLSRIQTVLVVMTAVAGLLAFLLSQNFQSLIETSSSEDLRTTFTDLNTNLKSAHDDLLADITKAPEAYELSAVEKVSIAISRAYTTSFGSDTPPGGVPKVLDELGFRINGPLSNITTGTQSLCQKDKFGTNCKAAITDILNQGFATTDRRLYALLGDDSRQLQSEQLHRKKFWGKISQTLALLSLLLGVSIGGAQLYLQNGRASMQWLEDQIATRRAIVLIFDEFFAALKSRTWTADDLLTELQTVISDPSKRRYSMSGSEFNELCRLVTRYFGILGFVDMYLAKGTQFGVFARVDDPDDVEAETYRFVVAKRSGQA